jgi:hypothetical protein
MKGAFVAKSATNAAFTAVTDRPLTPCAGRLAGRLGRQGEGEAMGDSTYAWVSDHECFGATVVEGMAAEGALAALSAGTALEVPTPWQDDRPDDQPVVGVLDLDGRLLLWENYPWIGLDPRAPRRLSAGGRCVSVAYGMTQWMLTVAEGGTTVRAFDPLLRAPDDPDDPWFDEDDDPEAQRVGDPLPAESDVDWAADGRAACLRMVELLTGVRVSDGVWDDPGVRWFVYDEPEPEVVDLPPLLAVLTSASPLERHARLRAGLVRAAVILGLQDHPPFVRLLADADAQRRSVGTLRGAAPFNRAVERLHEWELPLGQRVEPILYPVPGVNWPPPPRGERYRPTDEEKAELRLAMACSDFLVSAGLDHRDGLEAVYQLEQAVGDRFPEVEAAMLADPAGEQTSRS